MNLAIPLSLARLCRLAGVSRAGLYRWRGEAPAEKGDMELSLQRRKPVARNPDLRDAIQRLALEWPCMAAAALPGDCAGRAGQSTANGCNG
jgi:hypothetical protein